MQGFRFKTFSRLYLLPFQYGKTFNKTWKVKYRPWDSDFFSFFREVSLSRGKIRSYFDFSWLAYLQRGVHPVSCKLLTSQKDNISCQNDKESCQEALQNMVSWTFINTTKFLIATATNNLQETLKENVYSRVLPVPLQFIQVHKLHFSQHIHLCFS